MKSSLGTLNDRASSFALQDERSTAKEPVQVRYMARRNRVSSAKPGRGIRRKHSTSKYLPQTGMMIQPPPWEVASTTRVGCFFNRNTRYCLGNVDDLWKIDHQFHPRRIGPVGYAHLNPERPSRLYYHQNNKLSTRPPKHSAPTVNIKKVYKKTIVQGSGADEPAGNYEAMFDELAQLRQDIKVREISEIDTRIQAMQTQQNEQQKSMLMALEYQQQMMLDAHEQELERIRKLNEEKARASTERSPYRAHRGQHGQPMHQQTAQHSYHGMTGVPPVHPQFGPAYFDYHTYTWTYPWAQWYSQGEPRKEASPPPKSQSPPKKIEKSPSLKSSPGPPSPEPIKLEPLDPRDFNKEASAAKVIARYLRRIILRKREVEYRYRDTTVVMLTKKWAYNKASGNNEIMTMYVLVDQAQKCLCLRFTIFDFAEKKFVYSNVYEVKEVRQFTSEKLLELAKSGLDKLPFERPQFKMHILCLISVIDLYLKMLPAKPQVVERSVSPQKSPPKPVMEDISTQMEGAKLSAIKSMQMTIVPDQVGLVVEEVLPKRDEGRQVDRKSVLLWMQSSRKEYLRALWQVCVKEWRKHIAGQKVIYSF